MKRAQIVCKMIICSKLKEDGTVYADEQRLHKPCLTGKGVSLIMNAITLEASSEPDVEQFSINGEVMLNEYLWQDEDMSMTVSAVLHGYASYVGEPPEKTEPVMSVAFDEDEAEALFAQYDDGDALTAYRIHFHVGDTELLIDKCKADITLKMKRKLLSALPML